MNNETVMNFDIKIKLRKDNMYDVYVNGEWIASRGSYDGILDEVRNAIKVELMGE